MLKNSLVNCSFLICLFTTISLFAFDPVIILVGPPGAGKGTFSQHLKEKHGYNHICVGDILRNEIKEQTKLGREIEEIVKKGDYVDPQIIHVLLTKNVTKYQTEGKPFILDGFGQNKGDIETIEKLLEEMGLLNRAFLLYLKASNEICQNRILNRSICLNCGHVYNAVTAQPLLQETCDYCGTALQIKINDTPEVITKRLQYYREHIEQFYEAALSRFPSLVYNSSGSFETCTFFYDTLVKETDYDVDSISFIQRISVESN